MQIKKKTKKKKKANNGIATAASSCSQQNGTVVAVKATTPSPPSNMVFSMLNENDLNLSMLDCGDLTSMSLLLNHFNTAEVDSAGNNKAKDLPPVPPPPLPIAVADNQDKKAEGLFASVMAKVRR